MGNYFFIFSFYIYIHIFPKIIIHTRCRINFKLSSVIFILGKKEKKKKEKKWVLFLRGEVNEAGSR